MELHSIYFIGIGGIGMSALARYFNAEGKTVSGYDKTKTELTEELESEGINIHYVDDREAVPKTIDLVVYTPAVPDSMDELVYLRALKKPVHKRSEVLGWISRAKRTIAIAGTHGKTTTTTLLTHLLHSGGIDCTAFLGGISLNLESNFIAGSTDWVVVEADEYDKSFLQLEPEISAILSIDADHLDIYGDAKHLTATYSEFADKTKPGGTLIVQESVDIKAKERHGSYHTTGIEKGEYYAYDIQVVDGTFEFSFHAAGSDLGRFQSVLPGRHNIQNAVVALTISHLLGVDSDALRQGMVSFKGIKRRFQFRLRDQDIVLIDDYAHHPSELSAAIGAAKELYPNRKVSGVFQPHLFSRTRDFAEGFGKALEALDEVFLLPIYPAREEPIPGVTSKTIGEFINEKPLTYVSKENLVKHVLDCKPQVVMLLGAGDIDTCVMPVVENLKKLIRA